MGIEIERKFLVISDNWRQHISATEMIVQGYLLSGPVSIRVRSTIGLNFMGHRIPDYCIAIKGPGNIRRAEFEYKIPPSDGEHLFEMCEPKTICKKRHYIAIPDLKIDWIVDEFLDDYQDLIIAEIELQDELEQIILPEWIGEEVTNNYTYSNAYLANRLESK